MLADTFLRPTKWSSCTIGLSLGLAVFLVIQWRGTVLQHDVSTKMIVYGIPSFAACAGITRLAAFLFPVSLVNNLSGDLENVCVVSHFSMQTIL